MDKLKYIRVQEEDGTYSSDIPLAVDAENVTMLNGHDLQETLGDLNVTNDDDVTTQLSSLHSSVNSLNQQKVNHSDLSNYIDTQLATDVTSWLNNNVTPTGSTVSIDKSLTIQDSAADSLYTGVMKKYISNKVSVNNLNNILNDITTTENSEINIQVDAIPAHFGFIFKRGEIREELTSTLAYTDYIPVLPKDIITSNGTSHGGAIRMVACYDSSKGIVQSAGSDDNGATFTVPNGIYYVRLTLWLNTANDLFSFPTINIRRMGNKRIIKEIKYVSKNKETQLISIENTSGTIGYIRKNGNIYTDSDGILVYTNYISVNEGDIITSNGIRNSNIRMVCAYDGLKNTLESQGTDNVGSSYTVPYGVFFVRLTLYANVLFNASTIPSITIKKPYGEYNLPIIDENFDNLNYPPSGKSLANIGKNLKTPKRLFKTGTLNSNETWSFEENNICNATVLIFSGIIDSFSSLEIGHGKTQQEGNYVKITTDSILLYGSGGTLKNTYNHNLTIANTLQIKLESNNEASYDMKITLTSNGVSYNVTMSGWYGDSGSIFVTSVNSKIINASFGWTCKNFNRNVYIYGDSYLGFSSSKRWPYYLIQDGYYQVLDGYGGRSTQNALKSFKNTLKISIPKYVFWCMGMNNPDSNVINPNYLNATQEMLELCDKNGIIPILATIPNVVRDDKNNTIKNEWVKNSGYRYVDFASAVNANTIGSSWYSGMLDEDGLHPNASGAITLYYKVLADFPEITLS